MVFFSLSEMAMMNCFLTVVARLPDLTMEVAVIYESGETTWTK